MSLRSRQRRQTRTHGSVGKTIAAVAAGVLALAACAVGGLAIWVLNVAADAPDIDTLRPADDGANSQVFDSAGNSLGYVQSDILREPVKLKKIPKDLQEATIAIEDSNFYEHGGVDYGAIIRAAVANAEAGEVKQGASTITQQLVRNLYIEDPKDTIERKIKEARMAQQYEDEHSKNQILNEYLNTATYGTNLGKSSVGVQAAAETFFDKDVKDLGLRESAMLAGLPQAPSEYNPFTNPNAAIKRRNEVLDAMADQGYITPAKAAKVKQDRPRAAARRPSTLTRSQPFFFDFVQNELIDKYGLKKVRQGGLKVYTTLNPTDQAAAEQAIANAPPVYGAARALVSTDTNTGAILAMASSQSYDTSQFNLAATGERQPGSSFKPFVLTTAVDQGMDPDTTTFPAPSTITLTPPGSEPWTVSGGASGSITLRGCDRELRQHRLRPARRRRRAGELRRDGPQDGDHLGAAGRLRGGARRHQHLLHGPRDVERLRDARQRRRPPRPDRDHQGRLPERQGRQARGQRGHQGDLRRRRLHGRRRHGGNARLRNRAGLRPPRMHRCRQDRDHRGAVRRVVRRLHARRLDGGLDRQPRRADAAPRLRRHPLGAGLAGLHGGRRHRWLPRFPGPEGSGRSLDLLEQQLLVHVDLRHDLDDHRPGSDYRDDDAAPTGDTNGDGYPDNAYAPGIQGNGGN